MSNQKITSVKRKHKRADPPEIVAAKRARRAARKAAKEAGLPNKPVITPTAYKYRITDEATGTKRTCYYDDLNAPYKELLGLDSKDDAFTREKLKESYAGHKIELLKVVRGYDAIKKFAEATNSTSPTAPKPFGRSVIVGPANT